MVTTIRFDHRCSRLISRLCIWSSYDTTFRSAVRSAVHTTIKPSVKASSGHPSCQLSCYPSGQSSTHPFMQPQSTSSIEIINRHHQLKSSIKIFIYLRDLRYHLCKSRQISTYNGQMKVDMCHNYLYLQKHFVQLPSPRHFLWYCCLQPSHVWIRLSGIFLVILCLHNWQMVSTFKRVASFLFFCACSYVC